MAKKRYYAVKKGRKTGIYYTWADTKKQVSGFSGAEFKSFNTEKEAKLFIVNTKNQCTKNSSDIIIYTDGGSRNHGNKLGQHVKDGDPSAWAYLINVNGTSYSNSSGEFGATNNKMEVLGLVHALNYLFKNELNNCNINAILDSKYVLNAINNKWLCGWKKHGWRKSNGETIKNKKEFIELDNLLSKFPNIHFYWTKGHANDEGNNFVDHLLNKTMDSLENYQKEKSNKSNLSNNINNEYKIKHKNKYINRQESINNIEKNLKKMGFFS